MYSHDDTQPRRRLTDILNGNADALRTQWNTTEAAGDFAPLPAGTYETHLDALELFQSRNAKPGVKLTFRIAEGEHAGRLLWHDLYLTPAAIPQTKRDLGKLGVSTLEQLESADLPVGRIRCTVRVALRSGDDGQQYNRVRRFDAVGIDDEPDADPFAPADLDPAPQPTEPTEAADAPNQPKGGQHASA